MVVATEEPLDHKYEPPPVAVKVVLGEVQVNVAVVGVIAAVGAVVLAVTILEAEAVQPLFGLVTVTV